MNIRTALVIMGVITVALVSYFVLNSNQNQTANSGIVAPVNSVSTPNTQVAPINDPSPVQDASNGSASRQDPNGDADRLVQPHRVNAIPVGRADSIH
jgi:hypothetical protein